MPDCGNFGAVPMPPLSGSTSRSSRSAMRSNNSAGMPDRPAAAASGCAELAAAPRAAPRHSSRHPRACRDRQRAIDVQHLRKARAAPARLRREIGAAPERLAVRGQEHRQGPAAMLAHQVQRVHVDRVDIGPLLAIDLDVDEVLVHQRRDLRVLEALMRHHVAPVAGGVADRQQDRLVRLPWRRPAPPRPRAANATGLSLCCSR